MRLAPSLLLASLAILPLGCTREVNATKEDIASSIAKADGEQQRLAADIRRFAVENGLLVYNLKADANDFMATLGEWGIRPGQQIVVYDGSGGMYAGRLWWMLRWMGHYSVAVLDGGITKWEKEGRPLTAEVPHFAPATYKGAPRTMHVDADFVQANLGKSEVTVIDARAAGRYAGIGEIIDPVGGHIPGALNRPFSENLAKDGTYKAPEVLAKEFAALLGNRSPKQIVHQCGSGVSACHNILAMEIAGLAGSRLYPGSWSEWCQDPARPVATGSEP